VVAARARKQGAPSGARGQQRWMAQQVRLGLRTNATSWISEVKTHEHEKRRFVDKGFLQGPPMRIDKASLLKQERLFDPLLQCFRDEATESKQRALEQRETVAHLNRALDVQIRREQEANIITHNSKIEPIDKAGMSRSSRAANAVSMPTTVVDYNIITGVGHDRHHWAKPEERPLPVQRDPHVRKVQAAQLRDFNIVNNRYHHDHADKEKRDRKLCALEVTHKYQTREEHRFDPVMQKFNEREVEERHRCCDDAREVEVQMRREAAEPQTCARRVSAHYDLVTHRADDEGTLNLKMLDSVELQRKARYKAGHVFEHDKHREQIAFDDAETNQRHERVAHERWEEAVGRGFNIVNNGEYGAGPKCNKVHEPFTVPRLTNWEKVLQDRSGFTPPASERGSVGSKDRGYSGSGSMIRPDQVSRSARAPGATATPLGSLSGTARGQAKPRTLSDAGNASLGSARGRPPSLAMSGQKASLPQPPPPPPIPGSPVGSVYSRPKM